MEKADSQNDQCYEEEESYDEDQIIDEYKKLITKDNFAQYFKTATDIKAEGDLTEALCLFRALIEKGTEIHNSELNINLAKIYFQLGDCLLLKVEDEQDDLFGNAEEIANRQSENAIEKFIDENGKLDKEAFQQSLMDNVIKKISENQNILDKKPEVSQKEKKEDQDEEDDGFSELQLAWENIETARVILEKYLNEQNNLKQDDKLDFLRQLANYILRLGDIENKKENFDQAIAEYESCLEVLKTCEDQQKSRRIAEVFFLIANSYLYRNQDNYLEDALVNYQQGKIIIKNLIKEEKDKEKLKELKDLLKVFEEKIFEVEDEMDIIKGMEKQKESIKKEIKNTQGFSEPQFEQKPQKLGSFGSKNQSTSNPTNKKISKQLQNQQIT